MRPITDTMLAIALLLTCILVGSELSAATEPAEADLMHPVLQQAEALRFQDPEAAINGLVAALDEPHSPALRLEMADLATRIARDQGWLDQAIQHAQRMKVLAQQLDDRSLEGRAQHLQGTILAEQGEIATAIGHFHNARRVLESSDDVGSLALTVNALGVAHNLLNDAVRARDYYQQALPLARTAGNDNLELSIKSNLALIAADLEGPNQSIELHQGALGLAREQQHQPQIANQLANLCKQFIAVGQLDLANGACSEALPIAESLNHPRLLAGTLMTVGDLRVAQGENEEALELYQRALPLVENVLPFVEAELLDKTVQLHSQSGNYELAYTFLRRQQALNEDILNTERSEAIQQLEVQYQVEQQASEMAMLQLQNELQATQLNQRESLLIVAGIALLTIFAGSLVTWRNYRVKSQLQRDLAVRNQELKDAVEQVTHLANRDSLTGLLNRRSFEQASEHENARRIRNDQPLTLVMADIDKFKPINDQYGHLVGDEVLKELSRRIRRNLREIDLACRWGGEEFVLLLPDTTANQARAVIERLRVALTARPVETSVGDLPVSLSFGIAQVNDTIEAGLQRADEAMFEGKRKGTNRIMISNMMRLVQPSAG